jgi:hypothetical protein
MNGLSNTSIYELVEIIIKDEFSEEVYIIAKDILNNGKSTILEIMKRLSLNFLDVRNALILLSQKKFLKFTEEMRKNVKENLYQIDIQNILNVLRYPKILYHINTLFGEKAVLIMEEFLQFGILSAGQCIEQISFKNKESLKNSNFSNNIKKIFFKLVEQNYIIQVNRIKNEDFKKNKNSNKKKKSKEIQIFLKFFYII